jgi:hypothetical protein
MTNRYLVEESAFACRSKPEVAALLDPLSAAGLSAAGLPAVCGAVELPAGTVD